MQLKNISVLYGKELTYIQSANIGVQNRLFAKNAGGKKVDCEGLLLVPGFVNMHTHVGDSIAKDLRLGGSADEKIHPVSGVKKKVLNNAEPGHLASFMKAACIGMLRKGITTFVDFREGGISGVVMLKKVLKQIPIRGIVLGRLEYYQDKSQIKHNAPLPAEYKEELADLLRHADGIGISGPNENSDSVLMHYAKTTKIRAIHSAETLQSSNVSKLVTSRTETQRALKLKPHFLVHMTFASKKDLVSAAKKTRGIVVCPRANSSLAEGVPDYTLMERCGCTVALGTDNVMVNSADMFKEMDFAWKIQRGVYKNMVDPSQVLKMATVNGGILLGKKIGSIEPGYAADGVFFDKHHLELEPMHNPYAGIVQRASESAIRAVMVGGKIVYGSL